MSTTAHVTALRCSSTSYRRSAQAHRAWPTHQDSEQVSASNQDRPADPGQPASPGFATGTARWGYSAIVRAVRANCMVNGPSARTGVAIYPRFARDGGCGRDVGGLMLHDSVTNLVEIELIEADSSLLLD